jgi:hypothetical protein
VNNTGNVELADDETPIIVNLSGGLWAETDPNSSYTSIFDEIRAITGNDEITPASVHIERKSLSF